MNEDKSALDSISRRKFLALSGIVPALVAAQSMGGKVFAADTPDAAAAPSAKKYPIGLELYSVRGELARDLPNTLRTVAKMGYEVVEFYAPYYDWQIPYAKQVRTLMDDLGLRCYSTHNHIESFTPGETMAKAIELNQILGSWLLVLASAPNGTNSLEDWKKLSGQLAAAVQLLKPHGLSAGFHNHQTEWTPLEGGPRAMDVLAAISEGIRAATGRRHLRQCRCGPRRLDQGESRTYQGHPPQRLGAGRPRAGKKLPRALRRRRFALERNFCRRRIHRRGGILFDGTGRQPVPGI
jgi:hypothetical protein